VASSGQGRVATTGAVSLPAGLNRADRRLCRRTAAIVGLHQKDPLLDFSRTIDGGRRGVILATDRQLHVVSFPSQRDRLVRPLVALLVDVYDDAHAGFGLPHQVSWYWAGAAHLYFDPGPPAALGFTPDQEIFDARTGLITRSPSGRRIRLVKPRASFVQLLEARLNRP
jgi:hypothetical protein